MQTGSSPMMLAIASETYSCASTPVQHAACHAYVWDEATKNYLAHQRRILSLSGNWMANRLREVGIRVHRPEGAFYLLLDFSRHAEALRQAGIASSQQLCEALLRDTGVSLLYGDVFGMPSNHLSARLAYVDFDGAPPLRACPRPRYGAAPPPRPFGGYAAGNASPSHAQLGPSVICRKRTLCAWSRPAAVPSEPKRGSWQRFPIKSVCPRGCPTVLPDGELPPPEHAIGAHHRYDVALRVPRALRQAVNADSNAVTLAWFRSFDGSFRAGAELLPKLAGQAPV